MTAEQVKDMGPHECRTLSSILNRQVITHVISRRTVRGRGCERRERLEWRANTSKSIKRNILSNTNEVIAEFQPARQPGASQTSAAPAARPADPIHGTKSSNPPQTDIIKNDWIYSFLHLLRQLGHTSNCETIKFYVGSPFITFVRLIASWTTTYFFSERIISINLNDIFPYINPISLKTTMKYVQYLH